jgi:hypothetical protein
MQNIEQLFGKTFVLDSKIKLVYKLIAKYSYIILADCFSCCLVVTLLGW